jgi:PAS domain-containing protein
MDNIVRINFGIVLLVISSILIARLCGILPDDRVYQSANRARLSESLATNLSILISHHQLQVAGVQLELFAKQNEDLVSVGLRRSTGDLVVEVGDHSRTWSGASQRKSDGCYVVPISSSTARWGELEVQFSPVYAGANKWFSVTLLQLIALVSFVVGLAGWLHLRRILKFLDPQNAVPSHVREALDSFAEGVVILDTNDCIVLVNATFANHARVVTEKLVGISLWDLHWGFVDGLESRKTANLKGARMNLLDAQGNILAIFSVNASPVVGEDGANHGTMLAFSDVTPLERNRAALLSKTSVVQRRKFPIKTKNFDFLQPVIR